jgi:glycogen operon protein
MSSYGPGNPAVFGATPVPGGCSFSLFSRHATAVDLLLFDSLDAAQPSLRISLDPVRHRTGDVWHVHVPGVKNGQLYGYLVDGPWKPQEGQRFNKHKLLVDPYAKAVAGGYAWNEPAAYSYVRGQDDATFSELEDFAASPKAAVVSEAFDWEGIRQPGRELRDSVIYEAHVRGMTRDTSSKTDHPGSYRALAEKIPYLKDLGVTAIELLPVHEFNPYENTRTNPETGEPLTNFWGYSTVGFFSPAGWYASDGDGRTAVKEFKELVKAMHREGLEVILDVVYNHTAEGNEYGPTVSFRGLDNPVYYMLDGGRHYHNYSGCGNTLNCNHPVVRRLILDSLRHWVVDYQIDGFRFDLAAILGRGPDGEWIPNYSVLNDIAHDPLLANVKIIAEGWDADGLFKLGDFPPGWAEWNSHYRDDVRSFVKSDAGALPHLATRLAGSADVFRDTRKPWDSINFITAHDGFSLADLVSYNQKHNWANAEDNRDGNPYNLSWNSGAEGVTRLPDVLALRRKQSRNFLALLAVSQGTPMLLAGDEFGFSKLGNNNTYCHDNRLNWLDWSLLETNRALWEFTRFVLALRRDHAALRRDSFFRGDEVRWAAADGGAPDWSDEARSLSVWLSGHGEPGQAGSNLWIAAHAHWEPRTFTVPTAARGCRWVTLVDTAAEPGFFDAGPALNATVTLQPRSLVIAREIPYTEEKLGRS